MGIRKPRCPVCRARLNEDGSCSFVSSHENILKMRAEQARKQSEKTRGRKSNTPVRPREDYQDMARKSNAIQRSLRPKKEKGPKYAGKSEAAKRRMAGTPRDKRGRFRKKNGK